jgi:uncharacterized protein (TIGR03437 family)
MKKVLTFSSFCVIFAYADTAPLIVSSAASFQQNAAISPGAIITVKGPNLAAAPVAAPDSSHPPMSLGGVTLTVNDVPCALYYVSPTQINAVIDPSVQPGPALVVLQSPTRSAQTSITVQQPAAPAIFTLTGTGSGDGAIVNALTANTGAFSVTTNGGPTFLALFITSLDTKTTPAVFVNGMSVPIQYFGDPGVYPGMQQINIQLPASLAGAGRVELVVAQNGKRSNAVEVMLLPSQNVFADDQPNTVRSRELAAVAWIPGTSSALIADENDDVVRVIDLSQRRVTHVIALPDGAQPTSIGVHGSGTLAVVAERGRGAVIALDLTAFNVIGEFQTGFGASAVAVAGDQAVIVNSDADTASFFTFRAALATPALQVVATVPTGRLPRAVAVDSLHAYVTNEDAGSITVLDLQNRTVINTINLGADIRAASIQVLEDQGVAVIALPTASAGGNLVFLKLANSQFTSVPSNPDQSGGASSMLAANGTLYLTNPTGGSLTTSTVSLLPDTQFTAADIKLVPQNSPIGSGARSLSIDTKDNILLVANESDGNVATMDLTSSLVTARVDAVHVSVNDTTDDHSDRFNAPNLPTLSMVAPGAVSAGAGAVNATLTITGTNLAGASSLLFIDPATIPSLARGKGNVNRGNFGVSDPAIMVANIQVDSTGTKLTAQIQIASNAQPRQRVIRVLTPNGETSLTAAPLFSLQ